MKLIITFIAVLQVFYVQAQHADGSKISQAKLTSQLSSKPLIPGEKVPDFILGQMLNHPTLRSARISDFKGKLLILDFWNTHCTVCIQQFPKINKLQEKMGDGVIILPVGFEYANNTGEIKKFVQKLHGTFYELALPSIVSQWKVGGSAWQENVFYKLFPWESMPHEVWIDGDGRLIAITDHTALTESNIAAVLRDKNYVLPTRQLKSKRIGTETFLISQNGGVELKHYGSILSKYQNTYKDSYLDDYSDSVRWRFSAANQTVFDYYVKVYKDDLPELFGDSYNKRILVESKSPGTFYRRGYEGEYLDNWGFESFLNSNYFSYELIMPKSFTKDKIYEIMRQDFDRYFFVNSKIENRKVKYLALVADGNRFVSRNLKAGYEQMVSPQWDNIEFKNGTIKDFVTNCLDRSFPSYIILNQTGFSGNIDLKLEKVKRNDLQYWNTALNRYDLKLVEVEGEFPMLVLRDLRE
ncbi:TlpA family protein disulfide reductase [Pedobacter africanus]|uniref:Redoxin n=1 Tax=Pedobacter africanus TaxID=151894 RepID=A0A1W2B1C3_9SPHI|nr:TlpA disulfide reductase family protein [Pedobacter africanus]SMC66208.1 Redoxin [Pedobacter africanus]